MSMSNVAKEARDGVIGIQSYLNAALTAEEYNNEGIRKAVFALFQARDALEQVWVKHE